MEKYRLVTELEEEEREELKDSLYQQLLDDGTIDIDGFDRVTDEMLDNHYCGISFVKDDFFCNTVIA